MSFDSSSMLATGGIAAAVVAGWSQVKNVFAYLSSFIIVNAHLDGAATVAFRSHMRNNWKLLPSGLLVYRVKYLLLHGNTYSSMVPFKLPANRAIYRCGWRLIFLSGSSENIRVTFLRGTIDFDSLLSDAIDSYEKLGHETDCTDRFQIIFQIGREKGFNGDGSGGARASQNSIAPITSTNVHGDSGVTDVYLDYSADNSFKYDKSLWTFTGHEDPFSTLYFPDHIMTYIEQARQWRSMGKWYTERAIPWRRGWLLHGPGGTGKSSLAKGTAQELKIPLYQYFLSTLSDQEFIEAWSSMATPCVALLEDFDTVFRLRENLTEHKSLTFDCVLNQISGVASTNGVFLIVSTNRLDHIDPAMGVTWGKEGATNGVSTRPGRIDTVIEVGMIDKVNRKKLATRILKDWPDLIQPLVDQDGDITPVQFQEICLQAAYAKLNAVTTNVYALK